MLEMRIQIDNGQWRNRVNFEPRLDGQPRGGSDDYVATRVWFE